MNRIFLSSVIILSAFNLYADTKWIDMGSNPNDDVFFIDVNSIQKSGDSYTFWVKTNNGKRASNGALSAISQQAINCRSRESITKHVIMYDDVDGKGKVIASADPKLGWYPIPPDTIIWAYYSVMCNK